MPYSSNASTALPRITVDGREFPVRVRNNDIISRHPGSVVSVIRHPEGCEEDERTIVHILKDGETLTPYGQSSSTGTSSHKPSTNFGHPVEVPNGASLKCTDANGNVSLIERPLNGHLEYDPPYLCKAIAVPDEPGSVFTVDFQVIDPSTTVKCSPSRIGSSVELPAGYQTRFEGGFHPIEKVTEWGENTLRNRNIYDDQVFRTTGITAANER